jgi:hypothetical protein
MNFFLFLSAAQEFSYFSATICFSNFVTFILCSAVFGFSLLFLSELDDVTMFGRLSKIYFKKLVPVFYYCDFPLECLIRIAGTAPFHFSSSL